ncbi:hypothetical protein COLO4_29231 [Corchorus olitorius]|uniref:Uncharacterized protein n=1 Tax=Corchorus olitorius TaxID=93759 RepID=A0A1R3HFI1_9ROSI|nr:hypothetical protein COLO4_29231 [Corchorus olitorius]
MEGKAMRVNVVKTIMPFLMIALVAGQATIPTPNIPTVPGTGGGIQLPPGGAGQLPPGGAGQLPPGGVQLPPGGAGQLPPGGGMLPPGGGMLLPPIFPGDQGMFPPLLPGDDAAALFPPFIPGIGVISLPKRRCAGKCSKECQLKSKRSRLAAKFCAARCKIQCGIGRSESDVLFSYDREAQSLMDSCFDRCKNN